MGDKFELKLDGYMIDPEGGLKYVSYGIRSVVPDDEKNGIHNLTRQWSYGMINPNKTRIFSASYQKWFDLKRAGDKYVITISEEKAQEISGAIIEFVEKAVAEFYILK